MRVLGIVIGIIITLAVIGTRTASVASGAAGTVVLAPRNGSAVKGWATLTPGDNDTTYVTVQATGLDTLATHAFALMDAGCASVLRLLNPMMANIAGDGGSTSAVSGTPSDARWFGILKGTATGTVLACGPDNGSINTPTASPQPTATPRGNSDVPVYQSTEPPDAPTANPNMTPTPLGS